MVTVQSISKYDKKQNTVITIGTFDGVHIGHRKILERLINSAKKENLQATVLTFFPHPRMVLQKDSDIKLLNTMEEKAQIMEKIGVDQLIIHPFTEEFSRLSATDFVRDILVNDLKAKKVIIGYDHRFGRNRTANISDLVAFGALLDFAVEEIPAQEIDDISISSTKIRNALLAGDISTANNYLGYEYMLTGHVKKGKGLGKKLEFPTANLQIDQSYKLIPKNGVYVVKSQIQGKEVFGMMNIGYNPTVNIEQNATTDPGKSIEIHFLNFEENLYDEQLQIKIIQRLRDEHKFDSIEALKIQLQKDKETSLAIITR